MDSADVHMTNEDAEFILQAVNLLVKERGLPVAKRGHNILELLDKSFKTDEPKKELEQKA